MLLIEVHGCDVSNRKDPAFAMEDFKRPVRKRVQSPALLTRRAFAVGAAAACASILSGNLLACGQSGSSGGQSASGSLQQPGDEPASTTLFAFNTVVTLKAYCSEELLSQAAERCSFFEQHFSRTIEGSDVWNINHAGGKAVEVADETAELIAKSLEYCERSGGLFDITIGSVSSLWDFVEGVKPADAEIEEAIKHIDYTGVRVEGRHVWLDDPKAMIDLGGTAKGYIADDLERLFREGGCTSGIINLGGNAYALGHKPDGSEWGVGVQDPNGTESQVIAKIMGSDLSVVTSGLYERQFEYDGTSYYHILDPKTGYPVKTDLKSSSVASASSLDGDAYATWMFLLGRDKALELLEKTDGLEGLVVDENDGISMTSGAKFELL